MRPSHPPTGAGTLIVSLGFLQTPPEMTALMVGVVILSVVGRLVNRAAGVPVPLRATGERAEDGRRKRGPRDVRVVG